MGLKYKKAKDAYGRRGPRLICLDREKIEEKSIRTMMYHTQEMSTMKIEVIAVDGIKPRMGSNITNEGRKFDTAGVRYATQEEAISYSPTVLKSEKVTLLPTCCGRGKVRVRIGSVPPKIMAKWLVGATMASIEDDAKLTSVGSTI